MLAVLGTTADRGRAAIEHLQSEAKRLAREVSKLKVEGARTSRGAVGGGRRGPIPAREIRGANSERPREGRSAAARRRPSRPHQDRHRRHRVNLTTAVFRSSSAVTKDLVPEGARGRTGEGAGPCIGGRGGGRPDFAEAGGKLPGQNAWGTRPDAEGLGRFKWCSGRPRSCSRSKGSRCGGLTSLPARLRRRHANEERGTGTLEPTRFLRARPKVSSHICRNS